jgi:hypothetical protein
VFNSEPAIHFPGLAGLKKPIVWTFPALVVCLNCGCTEFTVPDRELQVLVEGSVVDSAVVSDAEAEGAFEQAKKKPIESVRLRLPLKKSAGPSCD